MKLYLAGPMRGRPQFNFPAFHAAAAKLRAEGHIVFSPAERDIERAGGVDISSNNPTGDEDQARRDFGVTLRECLKDDLTWICDHAEGIALLPGWEDSKGARCEASLAYALGLAVTHVES